VLTAVVEQLRCPVCGGALGEAERALRCGAGHAFDLARQGYVNLVTGRPGAPGDTAEMVTARAEFLAAGHFAPLSAALAALAAARAPGEGLVVEVGAGTGHHLAAVLERLPGRAGLALDASRHAARRAARAHPRAAAAVADVRRPLPLADRAAALVLDVFAPRDGPEFRRVLRPDGALLVATPAPGHLAELRAPLGLLEVDPEKERRLAAALGRWFRREEARSCTFPLRLPRREAALVAAMGPSAHHLDPAVLAAAVSALPDPVAVTAAVRLEVYAPVQGEGGVTRAC
jgi:23S rRNA (guanine745-N1)-methyltransferase